MSYECFKDYLQKQKYSKSTVQGHLENLERFKKWAVSANINYQSVNYNQLLKFIEQAQARGVGKASINNHLSSIKKYYEYLRSIGTITINPAEDLRLRNAGKSVLQNLLSQQELESIYQSYSNKPTWNYYQKQSEYIHRRNIVILGLVIYQGLGVAELAALEKSHLNLQQGTIYIPSTRRSNSRILKLNVLQMLPIQNYLNDTKGNNDKLFEGKMRYILEEFSRQLRKNKTIKNFGQLRNSVIMNWIKQYNLRQVQYMAGHKYISSTERYKQEDLQDLQHQLNLFHPLK